MICERSLINIIMGSENTHHTKDIIGVAVLTQI